MDFRSANAQSQPGHQPLPVSNPGGTVKPKGNGGSVNKLLRGGALLFLFSLTILAVAAIGIIAVSKNDSNTQQNKFVNTSDYQAVFLTNGQVYFGNITEQGTDYIQLQKIFYLTQNTSTDSKGNTTTDGNYTLVKLGCQQIHDPIDQMIIERSQVSFWENLNSSGKVVASINQFNKQNPKGPDCSQVSNQTQASSSSTTPQGSGTTTTPSTTTKQ
jgi:hypothetical protein